jgi:hypothetical protein
LRSVKNQLNLFQLNIFHYVSQKPTCLNQILTSQSKTKSFQPNILRSVKNQLNLFQLNIFQYVIQKPTCFHQIRSSPQISKLLRSALQRSPPPPPRTLSGPSALGLFSSPLISSFRKCNLFPLENVRKLRTMVDNKKCLVWRNRVWGILGRVKEAMNKT